MQVAALDKCYCCKCHYHKRGANTESGLARQVPLGAREGFQLDGHDSVIHPHAKVWIFIFCDGKLSRDMFAGAVVT